MAHALPAERQARISQNLFNMQKLGKTLSVAFSVPRFFSLHPRRWTFVNSNIYFLNMGYLSVLLLSFILLRIANLDVDEVLTLQASSGAAIY